MLTSTQDALVNRDSFQAISTCKLNLPDLPGLCRDLSKNWKAVRSYLTAHTPHQGMQGVHNQVRILFGPFEFQ